MKILTAYASRDGSTRENAEAIAEELRSAGHDVTRQPADEVTSLAGYDAAVVGSAVYVGRWLEDASDMIRQFKEQLQGLPIWLFSSGPLGEDPYPPGEPEGLPELVTQLGARDHRVFVGRLDKGELGLGERLVVRAVKAPEGDFRDWEAIRNWARSITSSLAS